jgi:hypothetical protein
MEVEINSKLGSERGKQQVPLGTKASFVVAFLVGASNFSLLYKLMFTETKESTVDVEMPVLNANANAKANTLANEKNRDCAIYWISVPKTASTTVSNSFMIPLSKKFSSTNMAPNVCIAKPGERSLHWGKNSMMKRNTMVPFMTSVALGVLMADVLNTTVHP